MRACRADPSPGSAFFFRRADAMRAFRALRLRRPTVVHQPCALSLPGPSDIRLCPERSANAAAPTPRGIGDLRAGGVTPLFQQHGPHGKGRRFRPCFSAPFSIFFIRKYTDRLFLCSPMLFCRPSGRRDSKNARRHSSVMQKCRSPLDENRALWYRRLNPAMRRRSACRFTPTRQESIHA